MKTSIQARRQAAQLFRACLAGAVLDEGRVRQVVDQIAAAKPRGYLETLSAFRRLVKLECERHAATIESAIPLSAEMQANVREKLAGAYGKEVSAKFAEIPALIGGVRIRMGSDVYDGSIRGRLAALERSF